MIEMTNQYILARIAGRDPNLRASDEDRERIADRLRQSHTEGRLNTDEFQERLERCYEAKTFGELGELVRDLPRQTEAERSGARGRLHPSRWPVAALVPIVIVLLLAAALTGGHDHHGPWLGWLWIPVVFFIWRMSWSRRRWAHHRRHWDDSL
jgi:hypothetical protein